MKALRNDTQLKRSVHREKSSPEERLSFLLSCCQSPVVSIQSEAIEGSPYGRAGPPFCADSSPFQFQSPSLLSPGSTVKRHER
jgi:hypothetical protein